MTTEASAFLIVFCLSFGITFLATPVSMWIGRRYGIVARAGGRRTTQGDQRGVTKTGGIALFLGFSIAVIVAQFLNVPRFDEKEIIRLAGLLIGGAFITVVGVIDDKVQLGAVQLGIAQIITAGIAIFFLIFIEMFNNPFTGSQTDPWPHFVTVTLSMLWLGLMMNTVNFMDGLDGLVAGVAAIAGAMLFINGVFILQPNQVSVSLLPLALMGSSLAFLLYNFHPAGVFMGGGAYFLGYVLGVLSIIGGAKMATILLVMGLPLLDLAWQVGNRLRQGKNPMVGDRGHLHFRLLDLGLNQRVIVLGYYAFCSCFGVLTLLLDSQFYKLIAFGVMTLLVMIGFAVVSRYGVSESVTSS